MTTAGGAADSVPIPDLAGAIDALRSGMITAPELSDRCSANRPVTGTAFTTLTAASTARAIQAADAAIGAENGPVPGNRG